MRWLPILIVVFVGPSPATALAQIQLDRFFPPAVGVGSETKVVAEGKFPIWPCAIECDRADIQFECEATNGQLKVTAAPGAAPGLVWVRMHDKQSATNLVPLLIEPVTITLEAKEPNNEIAEAPSVNLPAVVAGRLAERGDVDGVRVSLKAGESFIASAIANRILQSPMDAVLQIADMKGNVLTQSDDRCGLDPQLVYQPSENMDVVVRIFAFPATPDSSVSFSGADSYVYLLRMTTGPFLDHVLPIVVGAEQQSAMPAGWNLPESPTLKRSDATALSPPIWYLASGLGWFAQPSIDPTATNLSDSSLVNSPAQAGLLPVVFGGRISESKQVDRLRFNVIAGKTYTARSYSKSQAFLLDPVLRIVDVKSGREIASKDDLSRTDFDAAVDFKAKENAEYELQVSDAVEAFGLRHGYGVWLGEATPQVRLSVAADHYLLTAGSSLEIPITVTRTNGFAEKLKLSAVGLPDGVSAADAVSDAKGDSSKSVKLQLTASEAVEFQGDVRLVATTLDKDEKPTDQTYDVTFAMPTGSDLPMIWLTVKK